MKNRIVLKAIKLSLLLISNITFSDTIKVDLIGHVTELDGKYFQVLEVKSSGLNSSIINVGDVISYSVTYTEKTSSSLGTSTNYLEAITTFRSRVGEYKFSGRNGAIEVSNDKEENRRVRVGQTQIFIDEFKLSFSETDFLITGGNVGYNLDNNSISTDILTDSLNVKAPLTSLLINVNSDDSLFDNLDLTEDVVKLAFNDLSLATFQMKFGTRSFIVNGGLDSITITNLTIPDTNRINGIRALFAWAEANHSELFKPISATIQRLDSWTFTHYPQTDTYIGVNDNNEVWVLGNRLGGLVYIDALSNLLNVIGFEDSGK